MSLIIVFHMLRLGVLDGQSLIVTAHGCLGLLLSQHSLLYCLRVLIVLLPPLVQAIVLIVWMLYLPLS